MAPSLTWLIYVDINSTVNSLGEGDMPQSEGGFVWYELMTSDVEAAQAFYGHVVGWRMADSGMSTMRYVLAKVGERQVAGLMGFPPDAGGTGPVMWFGYILVADVDGMAERVVQAGGAVHRPPTEIYRV